MITVLLADDHKIVRDGLKSLLEREKDMSVVGEADNGRDAVELVRTLRPDVAIMDIGMRDLNGIDAARQIVTQHPETKVIALSMFSKREYVSAMLTAGARGYLVKEDAYRDLTTAIRTVYEGRVYLSSGVTEVVVEDLVQRVGTAHEAPVGPAAKLSPREREVLQLIAEGKSTKEVAAILGLGVKTVETHRRQLMERLGIYTVVGLVKYAIREGLVSLED